LNLGPAPLCYIHKEAKSKALGLLDIISGNKKLVQKNKYEKPNNGLNPQQMQ
jgi:hypothetical protein